MKQTKDITKLNCLNCGEEYLKRNKKVKGRRYKSSKIRPVNCVTCSRKCSREYSRKGFKQRKESPQEIKTSTLASNGKQETKKQSK